MMTALSMPFVLGMAAVTIDGASLYAQRRNSQALADLAAITAAANLDKAERAAETVLRDNGVANVAIMPRNTLPDYEAAGGDIFAVSVVLGHYVADPDAPVAQRFAPGREPVNAVQVRVRHQGQRYFASAFMPAPEIVTEAIASVPAEAAFSAGSRLLSLNGGVVNQLLSALLGMEVSLSAVDYNALLGTEVDLFRFLGKLGGRLDITAASYTEVLEAETTMSAVALALADTQGVDAAAKRALQDLARASARPGEPTLKLSRLIDAGNAGSLAPGEVPPGLGTTVDVMQILSGVAAIANGINQLHLDLGASIPGLAKVTVDLAVGEPPQSSASVRVGEVGATVHTAQVRLLVSVEIGGPGGLLGTRLRLPLYLEAAQAEAKLTSVTCQTGRPDSLRVSVSAKPGFLDTRIASPSLNDFGNFSRDPAFAPARIVEAPLLGVSGSARVEITNMAPTTLTFDRDDIDDQLVKTASTRDLTQSLTQSLIGKLQLGVQAGGLGLSVPPNLTQTVAGLLGAVTPAIDSVLESLLATLGIRLGEVDVRVHGASCSRSVLVQ